MPALLAVAGLHHYLIREGLRMRVSLVLETGEAREIHHFALLIGYGVSVINPWLAFETLDGMIREQLLPIVDHKLALGVEIRPDMMGDLAGVAAQPNAPVEGGRAEPKGTAFARGFTGLPETDVMTTIRAAADLLFKREVLLAPIEEQWADRRGVVRTMQDDALCDFQRGCKGYRVGRRPAGAREGAQQRRLIAYCADVDRVARNALRRMRAHLEICDGGLPVVMRPCKRRRDIGDREIRDDQSNDRMQDAASVSLAGQAPASKMKQSC